MIIDITRSGYQKGYLPKQSVGIYGPYFPTANAAFRRETLLKVGGFDPQLKTAEDVDLTYRISQAGYELWFEPGAKVVHHHRSTLKGLLKQWYDYGLYHPFLARKRMPHPQLHIYRYDTSPRRKSVYNLSQVLNIPFPFYCVLFVTSFYLMHLFGLVALMAFLFGWGPVGWVALALALYAGYRYFGQRFDPGRPLKSLAFMGIMYLADSAHVLGGFIGGFRCGVLYLNVTRSPMPSRGKKT